MKATTAKQVLIAAKQLLEHKGWCQRAYALDAEGNSVWETSDKTACFCLSGAIFAVDAETEASMDARQGIESILKEEFGTRSLVSFNDKPLRTKEEVLDLLDRAIAKAP